MKLAGLLQHLERKAPPAKQLDTLITHAFTNYAELDCTKEILLSYFFSALFRFRLEEVRSCFDRPRDSVYC